MARHVLLPSFLCAALSFSGCSFSLEPAYTKEDLARAVKETLKKEAGIEVVTRLVGSTFWVYLPLEEVFEVPKKPAVQYKRFSPVDVKVGSSQRNIGLSYTIKATPQTRELQTAIFSPKAVRKISNVWLAVRRVSFSMDKASQRAVKFYCLLTADITNGIDIFQMAYYPDLVKMSFSMTQVPEFQRRIITETMLAPQAVGDRKGRHFVMRDSTFDEFILLQIKNRVANRFQGENSKAPKSRMTGMSDDQIDNEVARIAAETLRIYGYRDFSAVQTQNLITRKKALTGIADVYKGVKR